MCLFRIGDRLLLYGRGKILIDLNADSCVINFNARADAIAKHRRTQQAHKEGKEKEYYLYNQRTPAPS